MLNRIKSLLTVAEADDGGLARDEELQLAAAALLVESACMDGTFDAAEHARIAGLLADRFGLDPGETETLIDEAQKAVDATGDLYLFTKVIKDRYSPSERIEMIEMLWEVAYADGDVDHFEANLIRRIGGLIYVSDVERGQARKRVMARLGIEDGSV